MSTAYVHVVHCPDLQGPARRDPAGVSRPVALYGWAPGPDDGAQPPEPVRAALWSGLSGVGDRIGFLAPRPVGTRDSVWRETPQGWLAARLRPLPGLLWTRHARTFDAAFSDDWQRGGQVLLALRPDASVPDVPEGLLIAWIRTVARTMPPLPPGVRLAVRAGTGGGLCTVSASDAEVLDLFASAFRLALDRYGTIFRTVAEDDLAAALTQLASDRLSSRGGAARRWFRRPGTERSRR